VQVRSAMHRSRLPPRAASAAARVPAPSAAAAAAAAAAASLYFSRAPPSTPADAPAAQAALASSESPSSSSAPVLLLGSAFRATTPDEAMTNDKRSRGNATDRSNTGGFRRCKKTKKKESNENE
jgi:hypothetical protein